MKVKSSVYWDKGRRENNQDSILYEQINTSKGRIVIAAVSDGIGGLSEGETASGYICERLLQSFYEEMLPLILKGARKSKLKNSIFRCFYEINRILKEYGISKEIQLGATISLLLLYKRRYVMVHLGDSRIYQITKKKGTILCTKDHVRRDLALQKCLGSFPYQSPDISFGGWKRGNGFLLCTDGYYHSLPVEKLWELFCEEELSEEQLSKRLKALAGQALERGEQDNLSAIIIMGG